jgi:VIT1/CCC1 family predicted Fe2+/Mn2+ transporter
VKPAAIAPSASCRSAPRQNGRAVIPLFPYLIGADALWLALALSALAAVVGGGLVARLTARPFWRGALRQLALGAIAAGFTYLIGLAVGGMAAG